MAVEPLPTDVPTGSTEEKLKVSWIVEKTINFYKAHFISLITVFLIANLITWSVQYYSAVQTERLFEKQGLNVSEILDNPEETYSQALPVLVDILLMTLGLIIVLYLILLLFQAMAIRYVYDKLIGAETSWLHSFTQILPRFPLLLGATIVAGLVIALGLIALVIPGIVLALMFILVPHAVVLEGHGPLGALSRSNHLTSGHKWTIFGFLAFWFVVLILFSMVIAQIAGRIWFDVAQLIMGSVFAPIIPVSTTLIYHRTSSDQVN